MEILRVKDHQVYHSMTDFQKSCYNAGLPQRYMGHKLSNMSFEDYAFDGDLPSQISSKLQSRWARSTKKNFGRNNDINGIIGMYSSPSDEAAFRAAGSMFEGAMRGGLMCRCVSSTTINTRYEKIPVADLYLIHGVTDIPDLQTGSVRNFIRDRDGSFRIIVMTASEKHGPWFVTNEVLRMSVDVLLCLEDITNKSSGVIEKI